MSAKVAIVTPVFEDRESFAELCRHLGDLKLADGAEIYLIAVDDGSVAATPEIAAFHAAGVKGEILRLARNVGHQGAIAIGLARTAELSDVVACVVMDCDGEDKPEKIPDLLKAIADNAADVAAAERAKRSESLAFRAFYAVYKQVFRFATGQKLRFGNFMALSPAALARLAGMGESWVHVAAAVVKARLRRRDVLIDRGARYAGASKMNFPSLVLHGMRAVMVFSDLVLTRMALALGAMAGLVVAAVAGALTVKLLGYATPGWVTLVTGFALSLFLQTALIAMMTLMVSSLGRMESPAQVRARAREFIARIEPSAAVLTAAAE
jgi:glycosyltransferase involved in cell wall biosynthesis